VIYGREDGFSKIWVRNAATGTMQPIPFKEATYVASFTDRYTGGENWEFETDKVRVYYSSPVTPDSVYEIDMDSGERRLLKQQEVIGGHDPGRYVTERLFATAPDGTQVPISLVALREPPAGLPPGPRPMRLDGYGGYGASSDPYFSIYRLALIDRGVSHAIAHIRGGLELGRSWWEEGRLLNKKNCFSDFIACAEHLIVEGHTAPDRLAVYGASNGGLLMGVVANERPDLFRVVVAEVPITDMIGFLLRTSIGPVNQDEFGDPSDPTVYAYQRSYSPYQNVTAQNYPSMFVTGGLTDNRVPYWQAAKWVALLRDRKTDGNPLLLRTEMASGHLGVTAFYDLGRELALWYAFILQEVGIADVQPSAIAATPTPQAAKRPTESGLAMQTTSPGSTAGRRITSRTAQTWSRARQ
jgi:oligopeptidase B